MEPANTRRALDDGRKKIMIVMMMDSGVYEDRTGPKEKIKHEWAKTRF